MQGEKMYNPARKIPIYKHLLAGNEKRYVNECLESNWISSKGHFVEKFEDMFAKYVNTRYTITVCNGTCALHLALLALGIGKGDEVIAPTLTYVATANAVAYTGATPVFVDSEPNFWQIDPKQIEAQISPRTRAIVVVHLYGHPCAMEQIVAIAKKHKLFLIEDCAEALGSRYKNRHVGTFGDIAIFSFYGNKTITTGEGGMVITNNEMLMKRVKKLKGQGLVPNKEYWHDTIGYNYRMTNICAAIGLAQIEHIETIIQKKQQIAKLYKKYLKNSSIEYHKQAPNSFHSYWMFSILARDLKEKESIRAQLNTHNIETRPLFYPLHTMSMYEDTQQKKEFPVAKNLSIRGINLPSWPGLTEEQIKKICQLCTTKYPKLTLSAVGDTHAVSLT